MKRAQTMARAAWSRPGLRMSSWSCIGPRRRPSAAQMNCNVTEEDSQESSSTQRDVSEPFLTTIDETPTELPLSSSDGKIDNYMAEITPADSMDIECDDDDVIDDERYEDRMTEVELWQQIERELNEHLESSEEGVDDVVKEIREEEAAAIAEVSDSQTQSSVPNTKEVHRFFPAGRIMHIVTLDSDEVVPDSGRPSSSDSGRSPKEEEQKVAIFLTPRSVYSKLRLSQSMIADHFMPVYRRQIEALIRVLENEDVEEEIR